MNFPIMRLSSTQVLLAAPNDPKDNNQSTSTTNGTELAGLLTWPPLLIQEMDQPDQTNWEMSNWSNDDSPNYTWKPDHVSFKNGIMALTLDNEGCPAACDGKPYVSGEYRTTNEEYFYGYYEARMKAARGDGLVSSFFIYCGVRETESHHEIDIEFPGNNPRAMQLNYYVEGQGENEKMIDLGFDASADFHNYGFVWTDSSIVWYVDGKEVGRANGKVPFKPSRIMVNFWPGTLADDGWLGHFDYSWPLTDQYDWIKYSPLDKQTAPTKVTDDIPVESESIMAVNALTLESIQKGSLGFNGGQVSISDNAVSFSASEARDPGFSIQTDNVDLAGRNILKFEIKGNLTRLGVYAKFIAQVYDDNDNDSQPSVSLDPIELSDNFKTMSLDLGHQVNKVKKIQFLLVTDNGSCQVGIKNIRFE